jgi:hexokinase
MNTNQIKSFLEFCDNNDIRKFNVSELHYYFGKLKEELLWGLKRKGQKKTNDGGLEAIDTFIKPVIFSDLQKIPSETKVIYGAYAGTNWITGLAFKHEDKVVEEKLVSKSFSDKKMRNFASIEHFAEMVGEQIREALTILNDYTGIGTLAISFGFPHIPIKTKYGRDAQLIQDHLTKSWYIKNVKGMLLGIYVLEYLKRKKLGFINKIYFANDTTAVALDVTAKTISAKAKQLVSLPVGFVMGTGDNGSAVFKSYKNNNLVNLEIGSAKSLGSDKILARMIELNLVPQKEPIIEYYMGGDYLLARLAVAMEFIQKRNFTTQNYYETLLSKAKEAKITSKLAGREISAKDLSELLKIKVSSDDLFILNEVAKRVLLKGAQVAALMVASVCDLAGWGKGICGAVPAEGTVFWHGYGFQECVKGTLKALLPLNKLTFVPGSGTRGISTEAMIREYSS